MHINAHSKGRYKATLLGRIARTECKDAACCCRCSVVCVCLSVGYNRKPYKNGWTDRDAVWVMDPGGPKKPCDRWGSDLSREEGILGLFIPHWNDCVSSKLRSNTGLQICPQEKRVTATARLQNGLAHSPSGWQVRGQCGLASKSLTTC